MTKTSGRLLFFASSLLVVLVASFFYTTHLQPTTTATTTTDNMVVVAVAGGSGNVGRTIVETLRATSEHEVIVLGRKAADGVVAVDYGDVDATADLLKSHNVHTVISTVSVTDQSASDAQVNLIKAAAKSGTTKRFIVSGWGVNHPDE